MTPADDGKLYRLIGSPDLADPVLVVALEGWVDAGYGAAGATAHLLGVTDTALVATFDTDVLVDHRSRRPVLHLVEGVNSGLTWPSIELRHGHDLDGHDVLVLTGTEPDIRWRAFTSDVVGLAVSLGVRLSVGLGAYPAPVPHTRPVRLATTATDAELAARGGDVHTTLDVPSGVGAAIEERWAELDRPAIGLWAQVPHYAAGMPYPDASASLVEGLARLSGLRFDTDPLREAAREHRERLDELVSTNIEHTRMVHNLEAAYDAERSGPGLTAFAPAAGEELAAEVERFLRDLESGGTDSPS
ncbi:MAG: PAC2 family protein [Actinobacteria bacterium]|nr:PAC2 family protein [Actinomycetota bacterium]